MHLQWLNFNLSHYVLGVSSGDSTAGFCLVTHCDICHFNWWVKIICTYYMVCLVLVVSTYFLLQLHIHTSPTIAPFLFIMHSEMSLKEKGEKCIQWVGTGIVSNRAATPQKDHWKACRGGGRVWGCPGALALRLSSSSFKATFVMTEKAWGTCVNDRTLRMLDSPPHSPLSATTHPAASPQHRTTLSLSFLS